MKEQKEEQWGKERGGRRGMATGQDERSLLELEGPKQQGPEILVTAKHLLLVVKAPKFVTTF